MVAVVAVVQGSAAIAQRNRALSAAGSYADTLYTSNAPLAAELSLAAYQLAHA